MFTSRLRLGDPTVIITVDLPVNILKALPLYFALARFPARLLVPVTTEWPDWLNVVLQVYLLDANTLYKQQ